MNKIYRRGGYRNCVVYQNSFHSAIRFHSVNMVPVKLLVALAAVYDGILYVLQPPNSNSAAITYDRNVSNATWYKMDNSVLAEIPVFKIPVRNVSENGLITFKIKFQSSAYAVTSNWQSIRTHVEQQDVLQKCIDNNCCISVIILGTVLLIISSLCIAYFFIYWSVTSINFK